MSKQDRQGSRTIADLERKYNFGRTFAEVIGIAEDAQKIASEANKAVSDLDTQLDPDEIFNRLTNYGKSQGIYRENGDIYVNATYIKSGKLAAEFIDAENLSVKAANIEGTLTAEQITLTGSIKWADLDSNTQNTITSQGGISAESAHYIASTVVTDKLVASPTIMGAEIYGGNVYGACFYASSEDSFAQMTHDGFYLYIDGVDEPKISLMKQSEGDLLSLILGAGSQTENDFTNRLFINKGINGASIYYIDNNMNQCGFIFEPGGKIRIVGTIVTTA